MCRFSQQSWHHVIFTVESEIIAKAWAYTTTLTKGAFFGLPLTLFLTPFAPRSSRDREPLFLGQCSRVPRNLIPFPSPPLPTLSCRPNPEEGELDADFTCLRQCSRVPRNLIAFPSPPHSLTGPKYREPKMDSLQLTRWVCQTRLPLQYHKYGRPSHFLLPPLPHSSTSIGHTSSHTTSFPCPESNQGPSRRTWLSQMINLLLPERLNITASTVSN